MATKRKKAAGYEPTPRVWFNWGFHDGAHEFRTFGGESPIRAKEWRKQFPMYTEGYDYGQAWQREGRYDLGKTLSTEAWNEYQQRNVTPTDDYVDAVDEANAICDALELERQREKEQSETKQ